MSQIALGELFLDFSIVETPVTNYQYTPHNIAEKCGFQDMQHGRYKDGKEPTRPNHYVPQSVFFFVAADSLLYLTTEFGGYRGDTLSSTVRSESRCALMLLYVYLVVSIEVAVEVCCCFTVFSY
jgi:hypothetical protein